MTCDNDFRNFSENRNRVSNYSTAIQTGGENPRKLEYVYDGDAFTRHEVKHNMGYDISIHRNHEMNNPPNLFACSD